MTAADLCLVVIWNSWVGLENVNSGFTITGWTSHPVSNIFVFVKKLLLSLFIWLEICQYPGNLRGVLTSFGLYPELAVIL